MSALAISLLGSFEASVFGKSATDFESDKVRALLAYLAVEAERSHRRGKLAALLWPDMPEAKARGNLRHALANLRQVIHDHDADPPFLLITRQSIRFNEASDCRLDVSVFDNSLPLDQLASPTTIARFEEYIALYRGDFLAGFSVFGSIAFEEWMRIRQEQYRLKMCQALNWLTNAYEQRGQYAKSVDRARRKVELQPWDEAGHRQLIRLLALDGQRGAALAQYEQCCQTLAEELDVSPTRVTTKLYERIRDETWPDEIAKIPLPRFVIEEQEIPASSALVAREKELRQLNEFLNQAQREKSQVVFITGEAGSGKTALMQGFARRAMADRPDLLVIGGKCSAYTGNADPYQPFRQILQMLVGDVEPGWEAGDISTDHARRLWLVLPEVAEALVGNGRALLDRLVPSASLLARVQVRTRSQLPDDVTCLAQLSRWVEAGEIMPASSQMSLFEDFTQLIGALAQRHQLLLLIDDLQWIDNASLSLLSYLGQQLRNKAVLILGSYRPEDLVCDRPDARHPLADVLDEFRLQFGHNQVDLRHARGRLFIDNLLDSEPNRLGESFRQMLLRHTGGHALFTIELLRGMQDRGNLVRDEKGRWVEGEFLDWDAIPARVESVIANRISHLPESCRFALTVASIEGETFTAEVVAHIQNKGEQEILRCLSGDLSRQHRLVRAQSSYRFSNQRLSRYRFQHFLFQKYIYSGLDPVERAGLHEAVGDSLEALYGKRKIELATMFGQLAWHYQEAGVLEKAIEYCQKAGEHAWQLSAADEAIAFFKQGLDLLKKMPDFQERRQKSLELTMGLAIPLQATRGFAAPEVQRTYDEIYLLSQQVRQTPRLFSVLGLLGSYYLSSGQYHLSLKIAWQLFELGQRSQDPLQVALARLGLGANYSQLGEFTRSEKHLRKLIEFYDYREHHAGVPYYGIDPGVNGLIWLALVTWVRGFPDQAERYSQEAIDLARILEHPFSLTAALEVSAGVMHVLGRDFAAARRDFDESLQLATAQEFGLFQVEGSYYQGVVLVAEGRGDEGITQMKSSLTAWRATGMRIMYPLMLGLLAEALGRSGKIREGLQTLDEAFATVVDGDEQFFVAELYRIKGDLLQRSGGETPDIETAYQQAINLARRQAAKSWQLRATIRLVRLFQATSRDDEARLALTEIFDWFTEGFNAHDLQEALALLVELRGR